MIRKCDGNDPELRQERVDRVASTGQESTVWDPCACGLSFDDEQRARIFPHFFLYASPERAAQVHEEVKDLVAQGLSAERIREHLTRQASSGYAQDQHANHNTDGEIVNNDFEGTPERHDHDNSTAEQADTAAETATDEATEAQGTGNGEDEETRVV